MKKKKEKKWNNMGYLYIFPWIIGFLIFQIYPLGASLYYSFTEYSITNTPIFVGFKNYITMFTQDSLFYTSLGNTLKYVFMSLPMKILTALIVAVILNQKLRGINFYRTIYYIPSIFGGSVAISILWRFLFMDGGLVNQLLSRVGISSLPWLSNPKISLFTLSLLSVWQFGSSMVLFLAALKQVPEDLYEAALIDGAGRIHMFFKITLPMISSVLFFNILMQLVNAFQDFTGAFVITNGGPLNSTYLYALKLYDEAFKYFKMGYASALSWVLFIIILIFTVVFFRFSEAVTYYEDGGDF
ncbi:carbohydrate ABC transporter permease [Kineothrix sp. MB12-C1]|uniref:carbohydrate ABC transporter permease n=1 Tax=Kineothrix sp. MB12-C1 TaxID=3070215 RepID=UPI0027D24B53|nr:sugar ABC transporter permease [Kineothrix sp. MB12-C1]WMC91076.1 sugar ABC transporter permease [Kineothrix sp. MB12-C1]